MVAALLLRAIIPAGFMPDMSSTHAQGWVICTGLAQKTIPDPTVPAPTHKPAPCAFALTTPTLAGADYAPLLVAYLLLLFLYATSGMPAQSCAPARYKAPRAPPTPL